jgi:hypothetical protein
METPVPGNPFWLLGSALTLSPRWRLHCADTMGDLFCFCPIKQRHLHFHRCGLGFFLNRFKEELLEILPCHRRRRSLYGRAVEWCLGAAAMRVETTGDILHRHDCLHHIKELLSVVQSEGMRWKFWAIWWSARGCSRGWVALFDHLLWRHYQEWVIKQFCKGLQQRRGFRYVEVYMEGRSVKRCLRIWEGNKANFRGSVHLFAFTNSHLVPCNGDLICFQDKRPTVDKC